VIEKIKVSYIDSPRFLPPIRSLELKTSIGTVNTPTRMATIYEYRRKMHVPTIVPIENKITIGVDVLSEKETYKLMKENKFVERKIKNIEEWLLRLYGLTELMYCIQPARSKKEPLASLASTTKYEKFTDIVLRIQLSAGLQNLCIPYLRLPLSMYKELLRNIAKSYSKLRVFLVPIIDMKYENFKSLVSYIIDELEFKAIGFFYQSPKSVLLNYMFLEKYVEDDVLFFMLETSRFETLVVKDFAVMHYLPFVFTDLYSVRTYKRIKPSKKRKRKLRFFISDKLQVKGIYALTLNEKDRLLRKIIEELEAKYIDPYDIIIVETLRNKPEEILSDENKFIAAYNLSKVHELKASTKEFNMLYNAIRKMETISYVNRKSTLRKVLREYAPKISKLKTP